MDAVTGWLDVAMRAGAVGILVILVWAFIKEGLVGGARHRFDVEAEQKRTQKMAEEANFWRDVALRGLGAGEVAVDLLKETQSKGKKPEDEGDG